MGGNTEPPPSTAELLQQLIGLSKRISEQYLNEVGATEGELLRLRCMAAAAPTPPPLAQRISQQDPLALRSINFVESPPNFVQESDLLAGDDADRSDLQSFHSRRSRVPSYQSLNGSHSNVKFKSEGTMELVSVVRSNTGPKQTASSASKSAWSDMRSESPSGMTGIKSSTTRGSGVSAGSVAVFSLRESWVEKEEDMRAHLGTTVMTRTKSRFVRSSGASFESSNSKKDEMKRKNPSTAVQVGVGREQGCLCCGPQRRVLHPQHPMRVVWDLLCVTFLAWDALIIPMHAFALERSLFLVTMDMMTVVYWTLDMVATLSTGIYVGSEVEMRPWPVARQYLRTWFTFDFLIIVTEWALLIVDASEAGTDRADSVTLARAIRSSRFLRTLRYIRLVRLLRMIKFKKMLDDLRERMNHEAAVMLIGILRIVVTIAILVHILACSWYFIGDVENIGWVYTEGIYNKELGFRYLYSFQWALSRLHPSTMVLNMNLKSDVERMFAVFATVNAMIVTSLFISYITNMMAEARTRRQQRNKMLLSLRRYLNKHHGVTANLAVQAKRYIVTAYAQSLRKKDEEELMTILPTHLLIEIRLEAYLPAIMRHPLMEGLESVQERAVADLCRQAFTETDVMPGETIFTAGATSSHMYFIAVGGYAYISGVDEQAGTLSESSMNRSSTRDVEDDLNTHSIRLWPGAHLAEASLWLAVWQHRGDLTAMEENGIVLSLKASAFESILSEYEAAYLHALSYGRGFVEALNEMLPSTLSDLPPPSSGDSDRGNRFSRRTWRSTSVGNTLNRVVPASIILPL